MRRFFWAEPFVVAPLVLGLTTSTVWAGFDDLAGTKPGDLDFGGQFDAADGCALCHGGGFSGNRSYLPHDSWAGTMMANAARDPVFRAALAIANQDTPGVGSYCLRCHSPIAFVRGHTTPPDGSAFDSLDMQGIGCDTCHRAVSSGPADAPYYVGNAQMLYSNDLAKRGPYADSSVAVHGTTFDAALSTSHFCGQCHQVTNPARMLRDALGIPTSLEFPLDTTYAEWLNSDFSGAGGASCIDCHTQRPSEDLPVATSPQAPLRKEPRNHAFVGANLFGILAVMDQNPDRAAAFPDAFALAIEQTQTLLSKAVKIEFVSAPSLVKPGDARNVTIRVENLSGHKFPTGYAEGRRAWIALVLVDSNGAETFLRGGYDEATGEIVDAASTHVYRAQHGHWNGSAAEPSEDLALHDMILSDTRIPPKGFVGAVGTFPTAEIDYGSPNAGYRHDDEVSFDLPIPANASGQIVVSARVYYQSVTRGYVEHLALANVTDSSGQELLALYQKNPAAKPSLAARIDLTIPVESAEASSSVSSGMGGNGGAPSGTGGTEVPNSRGCDCAATSQTKETFGVPIVLGVVFCLRRRRGRERLSER